MDNFCSLLVWKCKNSDLSPDIDGQRYPYGYLFHPLRSTVQNSEKNNKASTEIEALEVRKAMLREALEAALNDGTLEAWSFFFFWGGGVLKILESRDFCRGPFFSGGHGAFSPPIIFVTNDVFYVFSMFVTGSLCCRLQPSSKDLSFVFMCFDPQQLVEILPGTLLRSFYVNACFNVFHEHLQEKGSNSLKWVKQSSMLSKTEEKPSHASDFLI